MLRGLRNKDCLYFQAKWVSEGLQSDSLSLENGAIMTNVSRWSLVIDPQLQGRAWIAAREAKNNLCILQQSQPGYVEKVGIRPILNLLLNYTESNKQLYEKESLKGTGAETSARRSCVTGLRLRCLGKPHLLCRCCNAFKKGVRCSSKICLRISTLCSTP